MKNGVTVRQREQQIGGWKKQLDELLATPDNKIELAAHIAALDGLGLDGIAKAKLIAKSMLGVVENGTTRTIDDETRRGLRKKIGSGLMTAIGLARGRTKSLDELNAVRIDLADQLDDIACGPLAQTIAEHLRALRDGHLAVSIASQFGDGLYLTSKGRFVTRRSGEESVFYSKPTTRHLRMRGCTPKSIDEILVGLVEDIGNGTPLATCPVSMPFWTKLRTQQGPKESLPAPLSEAPDSAMAANADKANQAENAKIEFMATAKAAFDRFDVVLSHDAGVAALLDHLHEHGESDGKTGIVITPQIVLTSDGFKRVTTKTSDTYFSHSQWWKGETTSFSRVTLEDVIDRQISKKDIDDGLGKALEALIKHNGGKPRKMDALTTTAGKRHVSLGG